MILLNVILFSSLIFLILIIRSCAVFSMREPLSCSFLNKMCSCVDGFVFKHNTSFTKYGTCNQPTVLVYFNHPKREPVTAWQRQCRFPCLYVGEITMEIEDLILEILTCYPHLFEKAQEVLNTLLASQNSLDGDCTLS